MLKIQKGLMLAAPLVLMAELGFAGHSGAGAGACSNALKIPLLLFTLGGGYWLLIYAGKQKKPMNRIGQAISIIIILVALCGVICTLVFRFCYYSHACGPSSKKAACPYTSEKPEAKKQHL